MEMDSPQSVLSPFKRASVLTEFEKHAADLFHNGPGFLSREIPDQRKDIQFTMPRIQLVL